MSLNIEALEKMIKDAIIHFWKSREKAADNQKKRGITDQGTRSSVTAGKNLDGFTKMFKQLVVDNGIDESSVYTVGRKNLTIPGYYRPIKNWDLIVVNKNKLIAVMELKSQVGPSFGNNFNNRVEEAIGNATDLNTAFREGVFGESSKPFFGYLFVLEECESSLNPVKFTSPHFTTFPEFENTSYAQRYEIFCRKLVQEQLYDSAALLLTDRTKASSGEYRCLSDLTNVKTFAITLAGKTAGMLLE